MHFILMCACGDHHKARPAPQELILVLLQLQLTFCDHVIESAFNRKNNHQMGICLRSHKMTDLGTLHESVELPDDTVRSFPLLFLLWTIAE